MTKIKTLHFFAFVVSLFFLPSTLWSFQTGGDEANPFILAFDEGPVTATPGGNFDFEVLFQVPEQHYLYYDKVNIVLHTQGQVAPGVLNKPFGVRKYDPFFAREVDIYESGDFAVKLPLKIPDKGWEGELALFGKIKFQGCSSKLCYRLMEIPFELKLVSSSAGGRPDTHQHPTIVEMIKTLLINPEFAEVARHGIWIALLVAFIGGILTDFTPCVLPMIPVTLAIIGIRREQSIAKNVKLVSLMVLGMAVMYSALGVIAAAIGKGLGFLFQNIVFLILLDLFFLVMGLSLLGFFTLQIPPSLQTRLSRIRGSGAGGIFLIGLTMGLIAAPCVGPVVGPLLVFVAATRNLVTGFFLLLAYALGMGLLFLILGGIFGTLKVKIRSGKWTEWLKKGLGLVLLFFAFSYGKILYGQILALPPGALPRPNWIYTMEEGLQVASRESKPVLIDFYAKWCAPCGELDRKVFSLPEIRQELDQNWVAIKINCTRNSNECQSAVKRNDVVGWPTLVFLDSQQNEVRQARKVGEVLSPEDMLKILQTIR